MSTPTGPGGAGTLLEQAERYFAHDHRVLQLFVDTAPPTRFEPAVLLAHPDGPHALDLLAARVREAGWANEPDGSPLHELARGVAVGTDETDAALGPELAVVARRVGLVVPAGSLRWRLGFGLLALDGLLAPVPRERQASDYIYLGPEALYLEDVRAALGVTGSAAYLGCGAGHLAVVLARACDRLWATDLLPRAAAMTALALRLNAEALPGLRTRVGVHVADVGAALRPGRFDLVVANPPWVPTDAGPTGRTFADGGPTGCELPLRFLRDALDALRPGGVAALSTLDPTMQDGRRPIVEALAALDAHDGGTAFVTACVPTPMLARRPDFEEHLLARHPGVRAGRHVAVLVARLAPDQPSDRASTTARLTTARDTLVANGWPSA